MKRAVLTIIAVCLLTLPVYSQYFGQNRMRYKQLDFKVLKTENFDIHYYDEHAETAVEFGRMAERWYRRLSMVFNHELSTRQPIILYASHTDFSGTTVVDSAIGETTGGVTEALRRRIAMPLADSFSGTDHVLGHELVHAFQFDMTTGPGAIPGSGGLPGVLQLPLWFVEGMAEYLSLGSVDSHTAMWMRDAVNRDQLPEINRLDHPDYFPYRWGHAFWAYVAGQYGDSIVGQIMHAAAIVGSAEGGIAEVLNIEIKQLSQDWHEAMHTHYGPVLEVTVPAEEIPEVIGRATGFRDINISPVLSPDGNYVALFSEKDLLSIDLFLVDITTGETRRRLTDTAIDPHYDNLHFVRSAGAWDAEGDRFAYSSVRAGYPEITIYNLSSRRNERQITVREVSDISGISWFPDGASVVFSGTSGGRTDLFRLDLRSDRVQRLTDDVFTALHPAVSPDGSRVVFSTDRFSSNLEVLDFGEVRLGLLNISTGQVEAIPVFERGKHIGPQWSADGTSLYFISDRDGISNIYRVRLDTGEIRQLTNLQTGVSGISSQGPAFSVAESAGRLVFSSFINDAYTIHLLEGPEALAGFPPVETVEPLSAGALPTLWRSTEVVSRFLQTPREGLADAEYFERVLYRPSLALEYVAPPSVGVGLSNYGTMVGGGIALYWSDLLNHHNMMTAFQTVTTLDDKFLNNLSVIGAYENQKTTWNWGIVGGQVPFLTGSFGRSTGIIGGQQVIIDETIRFWEISRQAAMTFAKPMSRARRMEFSGGFQNLSFDAEGRLDIFSAATGQRIAEQDYSPLVPDPLNLGTANAAMVYDTSLFGGTSPILGQRYRFEAGVAAGTLTYSTLLADYRRYYRLAGPLTFAGRMLHYGRYGGDADDRRLGDLSVGFPSLVRGYEPGSFSASECVITGEQTLFCPAFDRLFGSKMVVANAELRLPLLGFRGIIPSRSAPPVEIAPFYDVGMAWRSMDTSVARRPVSSTGASLRFNVFGFFIGQVSYVHSFSRPQRPWGWEFTIVPGF
jgi:Tol biopolymer transport system component